MTRGGPPRVGASWLHAGIKYEVRGTRYDSTVLRVPCTVYATPPLPHKHGKRVTANDRTKVYKPNVENYGTGLEEG